MLSQYYMYSNTYPTVVIISQWWATYHNTTVYCNYSKTLLNSPPLKFRRLKNISPTEAFKKLLPILESRPIALATSDTSAPVASQIALIALMLEIRCARKALAACKERQERQMFNRWQNLLKGEMYLKDIFILHMIANDL